MKPPRSRSAEKRRGLWFLLAWAILIISGIIEKRMYGHPDRMMFYHLPAAMFLVLSCYELSAPYRRRNRAARELWEKRFATPARPGRSPSRTPEVSLRS